jgi:hypothetical protein
LRPWHGAVDAADDKVLAVVQAEVGGNLLAVLGFDGVLGANVADARQPHRLDELVLCDQLGGGGGGGGALDDRLREGDDRARLGEGGDLREQVEVVLHGLRGVEAGVDDGKRGWRVTSCRNTLLRNR